MSTLSLCVPLSVPPLWSQFCLRVVSLSVCWVSTFCPVFSLTVSPSFSVSSLYLVYSCVCLLSFHLIIAYPVSFVSSPGFVFLPPCEVSHVSVCLPFVLLKFVCLCLSVYFDFVLLPLSRYSWFVSAVSPAVSTCPNHLPILSQSPFVPCWNLKLYSLRVSQFLCFPASVLLPL